MCKCKAILTLNPLLFDGQIYDWQETQSCPVAITSFHPQWAHRVGVPSWCVEIRRRLSDISLSAVSVRFPVISLDVSNSLAEGTFNEVVSGCSMVSYIVLGGVLLFAPVVVVVYAAGLYSFGLPRWDWRSFSIVFTCCGVNVPGSKEPDRPARVNPRDEAPILGSALS